MAKGACSMTGKKMPPRYEPAREDGLKPWFVTLREWGRSSTWIVWAESSGQAKFEAIGRMRYVTATVRRATPADVQANPERR